MNATKAITGAVRTPPSDPYEGVPVRKVAPGRHGRPSAPRPKRARKARYKPLTTRHSEAFVSLINTIASYRGWGWRLSELASDLTAYKDWPPCDRRSLKAVVEWASCKGMGTNRYRRFIKAAWNVAKAKRGKRGQSK